MKNEDDLRNELFELHKQLSEARLQATRNELMYRELKAFVAGFHKDSGCDATKAILSYALKIEISQSYNKL